LIGWTQASEFRTNSGRPVLLLGDDRVQRPWPGVPPVEPVPCPWRFPFSGIDVDANPHCGCQSHRMSLGFFCCSGPGTLQRCPDCCKRQAPVRGRNLQDAVFSICRHDPSHCRLPLTRVNCRLSTKQMDGAVPAPPFAAEGVDVTANGITRSCVVDEIQSAAGASGTVPGDAATKSALFSATDSAQPATCTSVTHWRAGRPRVALCAGTNLGSTDAGEALVWSDNY
jgi:hypothetical protein